MEQNLLILINACFTPPRTNEEIFHPLWFQNAPAEMATIDADLPARCRFGRGVGFDGIPPHNADTFALPCADFLSAIFQSQSDGTPSAYVCDSDLRDPDLHNILMRANPDTHYVWCGDLS